MAERSDTTPSNKDKPNKPGKRPTPRKPEFGVGSAYNEGEVILGAKPVTQPWETEEPNTTALSNSGRPNDDQAIGETGGTEEPGGTVGDTND